MSDNPDEELFKVVAFVMAFFPFDFTLENFFRLLGSLPNRFSILRV